MFTDSTPIIESNKNITVHMKLSVLNELKNDVPLSYVASRHGISIQSVYNIFESFVSIDRHELPEVMCIDEFKNLRTEEGKYACVIYDPIHSKIIDVIENRRLERLEDYFYHINIKELERVKYLISDMYEPYRSIHKRFFPNSTHIVDHFHFARYVYDALDKVRITIMNEYGDRTPEYRLLKKYWHLYIKKASDIKDYFRASEGNLNMSRFNELALYYGIPVTITTGDTSYTDYILVEAFSHLTFNNRPMDEEGSRYDFTYYLIA